MEEAIDDEVGCKVVAHVVEQIIGHVENKTFCTLLLSANERYTRLVRAMKVVNAC